MEAMSLALISLVVASGARGIPSKTISGELLAVMELIPLTCTLAVRPGTCDGVDTLTPATAPCMACITLVTGNCEKRFLGTEATDPVTSDLFCVP